ncbi:MAG: hypothetical protein IT158_30340 [Bryobacterales bacterium]|nr:hypothetical protein [Bryobacterales bacterium]
MPRSPVLSLLAAACLAIPMAGQESRDLALMRARAMAATLGRLDDHRLAVTGLARLGRAVCRPDLETARYIFRTGAVRQGEAGSRGSLTAWHELLASASGCDPALAAELAAAVTVRLPSLEEIERDVRKAFDDVRDEPRDAANLLEGAIPVFRDLSLPAQEGFVMTLLDLRLEIEDRADELFLDTLRYLELDPAGAVPALFVLGNYFYASPALLARPPDEQNKVTRIETPDLFYYDLTAERPETSPDAAWSYLVAVGNAISIPTRDSAERAHRYLLARQLYSRVAEYPGRLAALYRACLEQSTDSAPAEAAARMEGWLQRAVPGSVRDVSADLEDFNKARGLLRAGEYDLALAQTAKVGRGVKKALLYLAFAAVKLEARDTSVALQMIHLAGREFDHVPPRERPWLWLARAGLEARADPDAALTTLGEAVKSWNDRDAGGRSGSWSGLRGGASGYVERRFWLWMPGVDGYTFPDIVPRLASDLDRLDAILAGLRSPERRIDAQVQALKLRLKFR